MYWNIYITFCDYLYDDVISMKLLKQRCNNKKNN